MIFNSDWCQQSWCLDVGFSNRDCIFVEEIGWSLQHKNIGMLGRRRSRGFSPGDFLPAPSDNIIMNRGLKISKTAESQGPSHLVSGLETRAER